jgi:lipoyl(octanoyl) transferase
MRTIAFTVAEPYAQVLAAMQQEAERVASGEVSECFFVGEHPLTVTLGRSLKSPGQVVAMRPDVPLVHVERGGGATLHNHGQLVIYPLVRLSQHGSSPVGFLRALERALIEALAEEKIEARVIAGQTGVWIGERKVASLGVSVAHDVTRHGLALNVCNTLSDFAMISPCGFSAEVMTRVADFLPGATFADWAPRVTRTLVQAIG